MLPYLKNKTQKIHLLSVEELAPNGMQPRKMFSEEGLLALSESIKLHGFLQPITVRRADPLPFPEGITAPTFEIIAGERRWRAAKLAGLEKVPCVIREADKEESAYLALIENIQRKDLGFFEEAEALRNLLLMTDYSQGELAEKLSISPSALSNKLRLLSLPGNQREMILKAGLGERHARAFLKIRDDAARQKAIRKAAEEGLTAKATEALADSVAGAVTAFTEEEKAVEKRRPRSIGCASLRICGSFSTPWSALSTCSPRRGFWWKNSSRKRRKPLKFPCASASKSRSIPAEHSLFSPVFWWISCGWMCKSPQLIHGGLKGLSTFFKCTEHPFFCRIERLFSFPLFRQKRQKTAEKKLSTKNILYYYNYYFHVPIKKGLVVGSRTRGHRDHCNRQMRSVG